LPPKHTYVGDENIWKRARTGHLLSEEKKKKDSKKKRQKKAGRFEGKNSAREGENAKGGADHTQGLSF